LFVLLVIVAGLRLPQTAPLTLKPLAAPFLRFGLYPFFVTFASTSVGLQHLLWQSEAFRPHPHIAVPDNACKSHEQTLAPQLLGTLGDMGLYPCTTFEYGH
jgi:hypothetical protein